MNIEYSKIYNILQIKDNILVFDFQNVGFLNTFEIVELFSLAVSSLFSGDKYKIINETKASSHLKRINFFPVFEKMRNIPAYEEASFSTGNSNRLIELHNYEHKEQFYGDYDKIFIMLKNIGLTDETTSLVASSLGEVVDNAFLHNLGMWPLNISGRSILLAQNFPQKKELCFSYCDFGVGFRATLLENYPELKNNFEAIKLAMEENVTSRFPRRGGNGLNYLQKNIFNGFKGELLVRSGEALVNVRSQGDVELVDNNVQVGFGSNIFFSLKY